MLALVAALFLWPYDFQIESKGTLEPVVRRDVFAGIDGVVVDVPAQHGKRVAEGDTLVRLRNTDAEQAMTQVEGQRLVAIDRIGSLQRTLLEERQLRPEDHARLSGELAEEQEKLINLDAQQVICRKRIDGLQVHSPIRGVVVTWDVDNRLERRPVTGQTLLQVADPEGPWQLELHVPENDMGYIASAQRNLDQEPGLGKDLKVTYILATTPGTKSLRHGDRGRPQRRSPRRGRKHRAGQGGHPEERSDRSHSGRDGHGQGLLWPAAHRLRSVSQRDCVHRIAESCSACKMLPRGENVMKSPSELARQGKGDGPHFRFFRLPCLAALSAMVLAAGAVRRGHRRPRRRCRSSVA